MVRPGSPKAESRPARLELAGRSVGDLDPPGGFQALRGGGVCRAEHGARRQAKESGGAFRGLARSEESNAHPGFTFGGAGGGGRVPSSLCQMAVACFVVAVPH